MTRGAPGTAKLKDLDKDDMVKSEYKINFSISLKSRSYGENKIITLAHILIYFQTLTEYQNFFTLLLL